MADGFIESRMADHMSGRGGRRISAPAGIRKGVAAALSALSLASVTTFAQGRVVEVESPAMRVYVPSKPTGLTVLALPGGGYSMTAVDHEGYDWAPFFNSLGITYAVLDYKLPEGDMRRPLGDVAAAYRVLTENAGEWHVSPDSIGIMGFSAGGHLASAVATHPSEGCRPAFQILFYPVVTLTRGITHEGSAVQFLGRAAGHSGHASRIHSSQRRRSYRVAAQFHQLFSGSASRGGRCVDAHLSVGWSWMGIPPRSDAVPRRCRSGTCHMAEKTPPA